VRLLALDLGERRVGVAVSDPTGTLARPLRAIERGSREEDFEEIASLVEEYDVERVIVGRPLSLDGTEGPQARWAADYSEALDDAIPVPVEMWDERYTTSMADEILLQNRSKKARRKARKSGERDAIAAALILQQYLEQARGVRDSGPSDGGTL